MGEKAAVLALQAAAMAKKTAALPVASVGDGEKSGIAGIASGSDAKKAAALQVVSINAGAKSAIDGGQHRRAQ